MDAFVREADRKERLIITRAVDAARANDCETFMSEFLQTETLVTFGLQRLFRKLAKADLVPTQEFSDFVERLFAYGGDSIRQEVGDDLLVIRALRKLLTPYEGPGLRVYLGDSFWNRKRRTYGYSWTLDEDVARGFALGPFRTFDGGSVVLATDAPPEAIIAVRHDGRYDHELEVWIDRRSLGSVSVLERLPQVSVFAYREQPG